ncbi:MAG: hypothetical protein ACM336_06250 [Acidobacteriota bacterium]
MEISPTLQVRAGATCITACVCILSAVFSGVPARASDTPAQKTRKSGPQIRVVYMIPSDRVLRREYARAIKDAIENLQVWFQDQMGDELSFSLYKPEVDIVTTEHTADWYLSNPNGDDWSQWFWINALADGFAETGGQFDDPEYRWLFYLDADPACGQSTGGTNGVALLPANDLRGLVGEPVVPVCSGETLVDYGVCRWVGGLGHELGHALGLPHPDGCDGGSSDSALMCLGYITYPNTFLLPQDIDSLKLTPFFTPVKVHPHAIGRWGCESPRRR